MTWLYIAIALLFGFVGGWASCAATNRNVIAENEQFRVALRYIRGVVAGTQTLPIIVRYIDRVLSDEAGA